MHSGQVQVVAETGGYYNLMEVAWFFFALVEIFMFQCCDHETKYKVDLNE